VDLLLFCLLMSQIVNWRTCLKFPDEPKVSDEAKDLICHLLCDVESRLGTKGVEEIKVNNCSRNEFISSFACIYVTWRKILCVIHFFFTF